MQNQEKKLGVTERSFPQNRLEFPTFQPGSPKISTLTRFRESYFISKGFLKNCLRFTKYVLRFLNNFPAPSSYYQPGPGQSRHNVTCTFFISLSLWTPRPLLFPIQAPTCLYDDTGEIFDVTRSMLGKNNGHFIKITLIATRICRVCLTSGKEQRIYSQRAKNQLVLHQSPTTARRYQ